MSRGAIGVGAGLIVGFFGLRGEAVERGEIINTVAPSYEQHVWTCSNVNIHGTTCSSGGTRCC